MQGALRSQSTPAGNSGAGACLRREVVKMQYAKMIDLIQQAKQAGEKRTEHVKVALGEAFDTWVEQQGLGEISDEVEERLHLAFEEGYGICIHDSR